MSAGLDPRQFRVDAEIARAETLPATAFTDRVVLDLELDRVFSRAWLPVPEPAGEARSAADLVARRGTRMPFTLLDKPLFLQRDWQGVLRAYPNVCTHAWHTLVSGPGRERHVTCPQHGRQFECNGRFRLQPGFAPARDFPRPCDHLTGFPVQHLGPGLFTRLEPIATGSAKPFATAFGPMRRCTAKLDAGDWRRAPQAVETRTVEGNWKLHAWNYLDRFHIGFVHRAPGGLQSAIEMPSYKTELYEGSVLQWAWATNPGDGFEPEALPARFRSRQAPGKRVFALWWFVFPNLAFNFYPWGLSVNAWMPMPGAPEQTQFLWYHYVRDARRYRERDRRWLSAQIDSEDVFALAEVARGARSGLGPRGRFSPAEETGPHWFHSKVSRALFDDGFATAPAPGRRS